MSKKNLLTFQILTALESKKVDQLVTLLNELNDILFILVQSLHDAGEKLLYHHSELEGKAFRFWLSNRSAISVVKNRDHDILNTSFKYIDFSSFYSICRMQIENFTIMHYLFFDGANRQVMKLRYDVYKLHGILKQSTFEATSVKTKALKKNLQDEIDELKVQVANNEEYIKLNPSQQKKCLDPKMHAKLLDTKSILDKADIPSNLIRNIWKLNSNHAHSEHIGDRQHNVLFESFDSHEPTACTSLVNLMLITTSLIKKMKDEFNASRLKSQQLSEKEKVLLEMMEELIEKKEYGG